MRPGACPRLRRVVYEFERFLHCTVAGRPVVLGGCTIEGAGLGNVTAFKSCSLAKHCSSEHGSVLDIPACVLHHIEHVPPAARVAPPPAGCSSSPIPIVLPGTIADLVPAFMENRRREARELAEALEASDLKRVDSLAQRMVGVGAMYGFDAITSQGRTIRKALAEKRWRNLEDAVSGYGGYLARILITYSRCETGDGVPSDPPPARCSPRVSPAQHHPRASRRSPPPRTALPAP